MLEQTTVATLADLPKVVSLYKAICDHQEQDQYGADWTWSEYPSEKSLKQLIQTATVVLGWQDGQVVAAGVVTTGDDYPQVDWPTKVANQQIGVLHLLGVHPDYRCTGDSKQILQATMNQAKKLGLKVVHLDVLGGNLPAAKLYQKFGFKTVQTLTLHYDDIGDQTATVMEYVL